MSATYAAIVVRGWTKESMAAKLAARLAPFSPENVISISYAIDFGFWRRNSALVVVCVPAATEVGDE
jgi:hypothetical protein